MIRCHIAMPHFLLVALLPAGLAAQHTQGPVGLKPVNGRIGDSLYVIPTARELHDGRVLVPNNYSGGTFVADFATGKLKTLPDANGGGSSRLFALAGDSTLARGRDAWILLDGSRTVATLQVSNPLVKAIGTDFTSADSSGFLLSVRGRLPEDSAQAVRIDRPTGAPTLITRLQLGPRGGPGADGVPFYTVNERAVLAPDGWIAVLRVDPYRVDWRSPTGEWINGAPLPIDTIPMDSTEKAAYLANLTPGFAPPRPDEIRNWPAFVEPVGSGPLIATSDGKVLVPFTLTAADPGKVYAVVNRQGELEREFEISPGDEIVGFGAHSIYVWASTNRKYGHLERHPWP